MKRETNPSSVTSKRDNFAKEIRKKQRADFITQKRSKLMNQEKGKEDSKQGNFKESSQLSYEEQQLNILGGLNTIEQILQIFKSQSQNQVSNGGNIFKTILSSKQSQILYPIYGTQDCYKISLPTLIHQLNSISKMDSDIIKEVNKYNKFSQKEIYFGNYEAISQNIFSSLFKCVDVFEFCRHIIKQLVKTSNFRLQGNHLLLVQKITDVLIEQTYVQLEQPKTAEIDYNQIGQVQAYKQSKLGQMIEQFTMKIIQLSKDIANQIFSVFKISVDLIITKNFSVQSIQKMQEFSTAMTYLENLIYICGNLLSDIRSKKSDSKNLIQKPKLNNLTSEDVIQFLNSYEDLLNYQFLILSSRKLVLSSIIQKRFKEVLKFCELQAWVNRIIALSGWLDDQSNKYHHMISSIMKKNISNSITKIICFIKQNKNQIDPRSLPDLQEKILNNVQQFLVLYSIIQRQQTKFKQKSISTTICVQNQQIENKSFSIILHILLQYLKEYTKIKRQKKITLIVEKVYSRLIQISEIYFMQEDQSRIKSNNFQTVTSKISVSILEFILDCVNGQILCSKCLHLPILLFKYNKQKQVNIHKKSDLLDFIYISFTQNFHLFSPIFENNLSRKSQFESHKSPLFSGIQDLRGQKISKYHASFVQFLHECYEYYVAFRTKKLMESLVDKGFKGKDMQDERMDEKKSLFQQLLNLIMPEENHQELKNFVTVQFLFNYFKYLSEQYDQNNLALMKQAMKLFKLIIIEQESLQEQIKDMFANNAQDIKSITQELTTCKDNELSNLAVQIFENIDFQY